MNRPIQETYSRWQLSEVLMEFPGLTTQPVVNGRVRISGVVSFSAQYQDLEKIDDSYEVAIEVPDQFPHQLPEVRETARRIPKRFHTNPDDTLCLGSPTRLRLALGTKPTLLKFITRCVIPYLYGFSYFQKYGALPFGELVHGLKGIRQDYCNLFEISSENAAKEMVRLASMKKRCANKCPCPCKSGRRVGKCHNRRINQLRRQLGRSWFRVDYQQLTSR